jgi:hypothetical protein
MITISWEPFVSLGDEAKICDGKSARDVSFEQGSAKTSA